MKRRRVKWTAILIVIAIALSGILAYSVSPRLRVKTFVSLHKQALEERIDAGLGIPANIGIDYFNTWNGKNRMTEFILFIWGNTYYGCYYSPDDVPLAFQNTDTELTQNGHDCWVWKVEGKHGATQKISDRWYYFEASL